MRKMLCPDTSAQQSTTCFHPMSSSPAACCLPVRSNPPLQSDPTTWVREKKQISFLQRYLMLLAHVVVLQYGKEGSLQLSCYRCSLPSQPFVPLWLIPSSRLPPTAISLIVKPKRIAFNIYNYNSHCFNPRRILLLTFPRHRAFSWLYSDFCIVHTWESSFMFILILDSDQDAWAEENLPLKRAF